MQPLDVFSRLWSLALLLVLGGCASADPPLAPVRHDSPWRPSDIQPAQGFVLAPQPALAVLPATDGFDAAHAYTLPELIDLAQRHHPATRIAWIEALNAEQLEGVARNSWLPHLAASALTGYQRRRSDSSGRLLNVENDSSGNASVGVLSLQWLLFDFGERKALAEGARQGTLAAGIGFTAAHQQIIESVCLAYYRLGAARARITVSQQALSNSRQVLDAAETRRAQGVGTLLDVAQARQGVAQADLARVQALARERDAYHALVAAIGITPLAPLTVADAPPVRLDKGTEAPVERIVDEALARRPDIQAAHSALLASEAAARASEAALKPKVFLTASASASTTSARGAGTASVIALPGISQQGPTLNVSSSGSGAGIFVGVSVPIFDGGVRDSSLIQARRRIDAAVARLERAQQLAVQQIVTAQDALRSALASAEAAQTLQDTASVMHDAALDAYRQGVGTITAVAVADTQLVEAGQALADARAAAQSAAVTLAFATGSLGGAPR